MEKTAVDFLIMQIELKADSIPCNTQLNRSVKGAYVDCLVMLKQTKEMEKQQIIDAYDQGSEAGYELAKNDDIYEGYKTKEAEQYYNETFS